MNATTHHRTVKTNGLRRSISRKLATVLAAAALSGAVLAGTRSASALPYVNLLDDGPVSIAPGNQPVTNPPPANLPEPMPEPTTTVNPAAQFASYSTTALQS